MFKLAVLGPITTGLGVARQCVTCYRSRGGANEVQCFGFGAGCLAYRPAAPAAQASSCERKPAKPDR